MKSSQTTYTIEELLNFKKNSMLVVNAEYQRGAVWTQTQKKKLIDSVLRGYPIPIVYLHSIRKTVGTKHRDDLEIIDGQQRLNALSEFAEGAFNLFDPKADTAKARFPAFIQSLSCPWAGLTFDQFDEALKETFLQTKITVAEIETEDSNEVRDLFVRLQGGTALNHQETRDSWPGAFTELILKLGGKPELPRYPGHPFFIDILKMKPTADRGKTRQLAAQISMLLMSRREDKNRLPDISAQSINDFYYDHLDLDLSGEAAQRVWSVFKKIHTLLYGRKLPKLYGHDAIHAAMLVADLMEGYAPEWEEKFLPALLKFLECLASVKIESSFAGNPFYSEYLMWTRTNSDRGDIIVKRHKFYQAQMLEYMMPLRPFDTVRIFGALEREVIWHRQGGKCARCKGGMDESDMEIHHVVPFASGGQTTLANAAGVHAVCHPKSSAAVTEFASAVAQSGKTDV